jgi:hypothetical protein
MVISYKVSHDLATSRVVQATNVLIEDNTIEMASHGKLRNTHG